MPTSKQIITVAKVIAVRTHDNKILRRRITDVIADAFAACNKRFDKKAFVALVETEWRIINEEKQAQLHKLTAEFLREVGIIDAEGVEQGGKNA